MLAMRKALRFSFALVPLALSIFVWAQDETPKQVINQNRSGSLPFSATVGTEVESVNIGTGHVDVSIPFVSVPGRGMNYNMGLHYDSGYFSAGLRAIPGGEQHFWKVERRPHVPDNGIGWTITQPYLTHANSWETCNIGGAHGSFYVRHDDSYIYHDADGTPHPLDLEFQVAGCWDGTDNVGYVSTTGDTPDTSGAGMWAGGFNYNRAGTTRSSNGTVLGPNGVRISDVLPGGHAWNITAMYGLYTDSNGNQKSEYPGGQDTLGRTIITQQNGTGQVLYQYYDSTGTLRTYTVNYSPITLSTHFNVSSSWGPIVENGETRYRVDSIVLPNGRSYSFQYETNGFGALSRIDFPTGAYVTYTYGTWADAERSYRYVTSRTLNVDGQSYTWNFSRGACDAPTGYSCEAYMVTVADPMLNQQVYHADHGSITLAKMYNGSASGTPLRQYDVAYQRLYGYKSLDETGRLPIKITTTLDGNTVNKVEYDYDSLSYPYQTCSDWTNCAYSGPETGTWSTSRGNVTEIREYDWGQGAPGSLIRRTKKSYLHDPIANPSTAANYLALNIVNKVLTDTICDGVVACAGTGDQSAQAQYEYDNYVPSGADANPLISTSGAAQHDYTNFSTSVIYRGNATRVKRWRNTDSALVTTTYQYDDLGNIRLIRDPLTHTTSFSYTDSFANSFCAPPTGKNGQAWVSQVTNALNQNLQVVRYPCTGLVQAHKNQNDINASRAGTTYIYDLLGRPTQKNVPDGGQVATSYNDVPPVSSTSTTKITATLNHVITSIQDGLGRSRKTQLTSDPDGTTYTRVAYDALGRKGQEWNPTRCDPDVNPSSCTGETTFGVSTYSYDGAGRATKVIPPDGTSSANNVTTAYSANTTTVTDQAGNARKNQTDALGRLTTVLEDPGTSPHLNYETDYQYDVLGNLLRVDQKGGDSNSANWRTRLFTYNSLSQLLTANNPESGTISYEYDAVGNVYTKTAPTPNKIPADTSAPLTLTTTYGYDAVNRLLQKSYSDGTAAVTYGYDGVNPTGCTPPSITSPTNLVGGRNGMCDAAGAASWSYDPMGRALTEKRLLNTSVTKTLGYTYNLDGSPATLVYPSGRTITYTAGGAGRLLTAKDTANSINYVTSAAYAPSGSVTAMTNGWVSGGFAGIVTANAYNSRLQPINLSAATTGSGGQTVLSLSYDFHSGVGDNGDVFQIANLRDTTRTQNFAYDALNRIVSAQTTSNLWGTSYVIDAWGNLVQKNGISGKSQTESLTQTASPQNRFVGSCYDIAGNMLGTGACPSLPYVPTYIYDAENRLVTMQVGTPWYKYDGDGKRAIKTYSGASRLYWTGTGGDTLTETDLSGNATADYIYFNGKRVARIDLPGGAVRYYFSDHLGTASVVTDNVGAIKDESDYYPYGAERVITDLDSNRYKFTGKERDAESGLDQFGARYYASAWGRFMTPDWAARPTTVPYAVFGDPQSLNLYGYVRNDPVTTADADGHEAPQFMFRDCGESGLACGRQDNATQFDLLRSRGPSQNWAQNTFKNKDKAATAAGREMRKSKSGYRWEYGARIHKDGKNYTYGPVVTQEKGKGVDLPALQKNDVGDIHTHNYGVGDDAHANSIELPDRTSTVQDKDAVQKMNGGAKVDYDSYVLGPNGNLIKFTPNPNAPDNLGDAKVVEHNVDPDPNPPQ